MNSGSTGQFALLLRNGTVIDGTGQPGYRADVAVADERIAGIGDLRHATANTEIDVTGRVVAPGFIDVHTHDDAELMAQPESLAKLSQGVTTVIAGNCGISAAPHRRDAPFPDLMRMVCGSARHTAEDFGEYVDAVERAGPAVNAAFLIGHSTLRLQAMGEDLDRTANAAETAQMRTLLAESLAQGAIGLSTGLYYTLARAASTEEIIAVAEPLQEYGGIYTTHLRDEADGVIESLHEALQIGRAVHAPVVISHHKCVGVRNFGRSVETLALLAAAAREQPVHLDVYPYPASSTLLSAERVERSGRVLIAWSDAHPELGGCDLDTAARRLNCSREAAIERLQPAGAIYFAMDEADVTRIMQFPATMIGSDGLPGDKHPHPRLWGTFPRVLSRYVRERQVLTLEEAVHRMTGLSASRFGLQARGRIAAGLFADLTVFDPATVADRATFEHPTLSSTGIDHVFVNGQLAWSAERTVAARSGKVLRRADA